MFKGKKEKKETVDIKTTLEILPIRSYDESIDCFKLKDGSYLDIMDILPSDRNNLQGDELRFQIMKTIRFYRLYAPDSKLISMNFPVNTSVQRDFLEKKLKRAADPVRKLWLEREIRELELVDQNVMRREYYLMIFGDKKENMIKNKTQIRSLIGHGRNRITKEMSKEKKIQIVRKLCNMNSLILSDEWEGSNEER